MGDFDIALASWLTVYKMSSRVTCPRYITLPVMAWKRCLSSLLKSLSSGWSSDRSFPTPGVYVELQLAIPAGTWYISPGWWSPSLLGVTGDAHPKH